MILGAFAATPAAAQTAAPAAAQAGAPAATANAAARPVIVTASAEQPAGAQPGDQAQPQSEADAQQDQAEPQNGEIVVTGFRASLQSALGQRRRSDQIIDAITAEDIADFPDANLAESIQRLPGVSIDRDNGEGRSITIRGLGGDFQLTRLNGADAQNVSGGNSSDAGANRSRGFDFNTFASELFGNITVTKSIAAVNDEGSLGAIVDLTTGRPLAYAHDRILASVEGEYRENGESWNPRLTGLASIHVTDNFGILASVAYQESSQQIDRYARGIGQYEYTYRNSQITGATPAAFGFARPSNQGTGPTFGSDPAAYALVTPTTIIPTLPSIGRQDLDYQRVGGTLTMQWRPSSRTEIILDGVYSRYDQDSTTNAVTPIGLNRAFPTTAATPDTRFIQGTLRPFRNANGTINLSGLQDRIGTPTGTGLYPVQQPNTVTVGNTPNCTSTTPGLVPGTCNSFNPNNLDVFDYYNSPISPGYVNDPNGLGGYVPLLGRINTRIRQANVNGAGQADYLVLDDVDWRSSADAQFGTTEFYQGTLNLNHEFSDRFKVESTFGYSHSEFKATGLLAEFNSVDRDNYVFDGRGDQIMPVFSPGFDVADPSQWSLVKGLSTIRYFENYVTNEFRVARVNFAYTPNDQMVLRFGGTWKRFNFDSDQGRRSQDFEAINPTLQEAGLRITDLGRTIGFGQGLNVSEGTPTSFYAPDLNAFIGQFGINCNCVNKWGDFRAVVDGRQRNSVQETDMSGFFQIDFNYEVAGRPMRGNAGLRVARTEVIGTGNVGGTDGTLGIPVTATNEYTDFLPSFNIVYEPVDNFLVRLAFSRAIARPQLSSLTPGTTSFPNVTGGLNSAGAAPSVTVGNPYLSPFRTWNVDLSFEKYFGRTGLIAATLFHKTLDSFPQQIAGEVPLSSVFEPAIYEQLLAQFTNAGFRSYIDAGGLFAVRQFQDAPGGYIDGIEITAQTDFFFLPAPFDKFGITANYTHIESELTYLTGTAVSTRQTQATPGTAANSFATGPFLNTSPDAFNATLYYEDGGFSARVSAAYRTAYVNRFPLASGTCAVGTTTNAGGPCNSPVVADFGYTENTLNIDFASSWNVTRSLRLSLEGRNLTNAPTYRTMYEDNPVTQLYQSTGRIITVGARVTF